MHHQPLIQLEDVSKSYTTGAGKLPVLKEISLQVHPGEFVSIMGPSNSGKSTLLNMITGIDRPNAGSVTVGGQAIHTLNENQLARWRGQHVGVILQFSQLLPTLTVLENVLLPMDLCGVFPHGQRRDRAMHLLEQVGIADQAFKLPIALSGGQQQRAAIARALANDPQVIVGDEPTGNLDTRTAKEVFRLFGTLVSQGKTLIVVTHDVGLSERTGRVLHIKDGRLAHDQHNTLKLAA